MRETHTREKLEGAIIERDSLARERNGDWKARGERREGRKETKETTGRSCIEKLVFLTKNW